ncbi:MAG: UDP-N-acetylmuramate--L-alanine ligase [Lachnospiraceae bacterium]|nr:UDP-N-acetylmuramate--L-alanine ligase [Lachnospiraceae bacterium]
MFHIDFNKPCNIYFIGIGGISMSGFAHLLHASGFTISGSDQTKSDITRKLEAEGIHVNYSQIGENITKDLDLIVYTAAIHPDNPEFVAAKELGIPAIDRAEMVGQVMANYENSIAISGTHGKTTTTSMISQIYLAADMDPTISVGGILKAIDSNIRIGKSENFITEACEYTNSFLKFKPLVSIILNVEEDHLDFFKDINDIRNSFKLFTNNIKKGGYLIINGEIDNYTIFEDDANYTTFTYGLDNKAFNYTACNITFNDNGFGEYDLYKNGEFVSHIRLGVVGIHNVSNSLAAIATAQIAGISLDKIQEGLLGFNGAKRRFEYKGTVNGFDIIDDYAHHPTEIEATLKAAAKYPHKTLWCVFQPHTYTRTKAFLKDFARALSHADRVIITDIYAAREKPTGDISSLDLVKELQKLDVKVEYIPDFDEINKYLINNCINGDVLITMGAGNVVDIGEQLLAK